MLNMHFNKRIVALVFIEALILFLTLLLSIGLRLGFSMKIIYNFDPFFIKSSVFTLIWISLLYYFELYKPGDYFRGWQTLINFSQALFISLGVLLVIYYIFPIFKIGRGILVIETILMPAAILMWRFSYTRWIVKGLANERLVILGTASLARKISAELLHNKAGFEVIGFLECKSDDEVRGDRENATKGNR